jgi:hypothetical protein
VSFLEMVDIDVAGEADLSNRRPFAPRIRARSQIARERTSDQIHIWSSPTILRFNSRCVPYDTKQYIF